MRQAEQKQEQRRAAMHNCMTAGCSLILPPTEVVLVTMVVRARPMDGRNQPVGEDRNHRKKAIDGDRFHHCRRLNAERFEQKRTCYARRLLVKSRELRINDIEFVHDDTPTDTEPGNYALSLLQVSPYSKLNRRKMPAVRRSVDKTFPKPAGGRDMFTTLRKCLLTDENIFNRPAPTFWELARKWSGLLELSGKPQNRFRPLNMLMCRFRALDSAEIRSC